MLESLEYLGQNGYDTTVVCDTDYEFGKSLPSSINYIPIPINRGVSGFGTLRSIWLLYRIFKRERYKIVQYSTPNAALCSSIASWMAGVQVRLYCQWGLRYVGFDGWRRSIFKTIEKLVCRLSTYIEPDSKSNLLFSYKEGLYTTVKSGVVWNGSSSGVNLKKFDISFKGQWNAQMRQKFGIKADQFVFGFIGRLEKDKGINELFSAFRGLFSHDKDIWLIVIGPLDKAEDLDPQLFEWAKNTSHVIFTGYVSEVQRYLAAMNVFVLPSYREGFGNVVIEAEAMGVPVIVTDIPGPTDAIMVGVTGLVVPKADEKMLYKAMKDLWEDEGRRMDMANRAVEFVRNRFDQSVLLRHILEDRNRLIGTVK